MPRIILVFFVAITTFATTFSQQSDSVAKESVVIKKDKKRHKDLSYLNPKKATLLSIIPGGGQLYNKRYWKIPIIYTGLGLTIWQIIRQNERYIYYRDGLNTVSDKYNPLYSDLPLYPDFKNPTRFLAESQLREAKNYHKRQRDFFTLITAGIYVLQIIDASVDAHLLKFYDSNNFLSFEPKIFRVNQSRNIGLAMNLHIK